MRTNGDDGRQRFGLRVWGAAEYVLFLPHGTRPEALHELNDMRAHNLAFIAEHEQATGRPLSSRELARLAAFELRQTFRLSLELVGEFGADAGWVYRISDPLMVFVVLPVLLVVTGWALGGPLGAMLGFLLLALLWSLLVERLRRGVRQQDPAQAQSTDLGAVLTLPNVVTLARLIALWYFPVLLLGGYHHKALVFFAAVVSSDWADGFIARHYGMRSRLGTMLDPATDRTLMLVVLGTMTHDDWLPGTLGAMLIAREVATVLLGITLFRPAEPGHAPRAEVHWSGKLGFALSATALGFALATPGLPAFVSSAVNAVLIVGFVLNVWALGQYTQQSIDRLRRS